MQPFLDALLGWLVALVTACGLVGVGRFAGRLLGVERPGPGLALEFAAGCWFLSLLLTASSMAIELGPGQVWSILTAVLVLGGFGLWRSIRTRTAEDEGQRRLPIWTYAALAVWFAPYLIQTLLPDTDWDTAMYHVPTALRFLSHGVTFVDPHQAQLNFPAAVPLLYTVFLSIDVQSAIVPFNMIGVLVVVYAAYQVGVRHISLTAGRLAAALLLTTNLLLELGVDGRNDGFLALFFFACAQGFFAFRERPERVGLLALMGMAMGMSHATKLTGLLAVGLFGLAAISVLVAAKPRRGWLLLSLGVLFVVIPGGIFLARNAIRLGDPVYPFGQDGLKYYTSNQELRPFYADFDKVYERLQKPPDYFLHTEKTPDEPGTILNVVDVLIHPARYQNKKYHWLQPLVFLAVLLPFFDRRRLALWLFGLGSISFVALGFTAHLTRYSLPALPLLALGAAALLHIERMRRFLLIVGVVLGGYAIHNTYYEWEKVGRIEAFDYLSGSQSMYEWRVRRGYNEDNTSSVAAHMINERIADGEMSLTDRVFMAGEAKFDLIHCDTIPDMSVELNLWLTEMVKAGGDYEQIRRNLAAIGVTHIMLNKLHVSWTLSKLRLEAKLQNRDYLRFGVFHLLLFLEKYGRKVFDAKSQIELHQLR